jgi:hypothetical protein
MAPLSRYEPLSITYKVSICPGDGEIVHPSIGRGQLDAHDRLARARQRLHAVTGLQGLCADPALARDPERVLLRHADPVIANHYLQQRLHRMREYFRDGEGASEYLVQTTALQ